MKTFEELMKAVVELLPNATLSEDNDGQIIIFTNLKETGDRRIVNIDEVPE